jgi:hypothetical protein
MANREEIEQMANREEIEQTFSDTSSDESFKTAPTIPFPRRFQPPQRESQPVCDVYCTQSCCAAGTTEYDWSVLYQHYKHLYISLKAQHGLA